jgi:murein DD-endopeptidase MepM/ murein hydrolase activator NlpD
MARTPVPKPATAGSGRTAVADTKSTFINVRNGPGTDYDDIGDVFDNSTVVYYPASATTSGWIWLEQGSMAGWVSTSVVTFKDVTVSNPAYPPTPYDGKVGIWHWKGQAIAEKTIDAFIARMKRDAPNVKQIWVKVGDGNAWQGQFDDSPMAIDGPQSIAPWVQALQSNGMEFHAWCVLKGVDIDGEADIIVQTCQQAGVRSMILDVEPYEGYWEAGSGPIVPLMTKVRQGIGSNFHIGLGVDPRQLHYRSIFPEVWRPYVNSVHTMCYWKTFRRAVDDVLDETYRVWGGYGLPIIPILQGDAALSEQQEALNIATKRYAAKAVSWWRYGVIPQWNAVNTPIVVSAPPTPTTPTNPTERPPAGTQFGIEIMIKPGQTGFRSGTYTGQQEFQTFDGTWGWTTYYKNTELQTSKVWAEWTSQIPASGIYQISVFVPQRHATTRKARYKIHGIKGTTTEVIVEINQANHKNEWVSLGVFDLVRETPNAGKVFLNDVTGEADKEIAFDAVRFRQIVPLTTPPTPTPQPQPTVPIADGYDSPVGLSTADLTGARLWPVGWADASPYGVLYFKGTPREAYHTGADLNWGKPYEDKGLPVYACASGVIVFAAKLKVWGNVIVIRHDPLFTATGRVLYSRYGHVQNMVVKTGERVTRGQKLAEIGDAEGTLVPHLHFDLSPTTRLEKRPDDWPGKNFDRIKRDYVDPKTFIAANRPKTS